jgi:hypothetical protein
LSIATAEPLPDMNTSEYGRVAESRPTFVTTATSSVASALKNTLPESNSTVAGWPAGVMTMCTLPASRSCCGV